MEKREEIFSIAKEMMAAIYTKGEITDVDVVAETAIRYADALVKAYEKSLLSVNVTDDCVKNQLPIYRKYCELKKKYPERLILFRCGDFYEKRYSYGRCRRGIGGGRIDLLRRGDCKKKETQNLRYYCNVYIFCRSCGYACNS